MRLSKLKLGRRSAGVLFCTLLAGIGWFVINLSKSYKERIVVKVSYTNLPSELIIDDGTPTFLELEAEGKGLSLLKYNWFPREVLLNFIELIPHDNNEYSISKNVLSNLNHQYFSDLNIKNVFPERIRLEFKKVYSKKVPIRMNFSLPIAEGYKLEQLTLLPDSLTLHGLKHTIDTFSYISLTKSFKNTLLSDYSEDFWLTPAHGVQYNTNKITMKAKIIRFIEEKNVQKVFVINQPNGVGIKVFPSQVTILLKGNFETIKNLTPDDIVITANYNEQKEGFLPLSVHKKPKDLEIIFINEKEVEYLIHK